MAAAAAGAGAARAVSTPHPKVDLQKEHDRLVKEIGPVAIQTFGALHPEILTSIQTFPIDNLKIIKKVPDSLARRVMTLFSVHFTVKNATTPQALLKMMLRANDDPTLFNYFKGIPGIEVMGAGSLDSTKQCDHYVFQHESWYPQVEKDPSLLFGKTTVVFLAKQGYEFVKAPQVGAVLIYFKEGEAVHFGRVVEIKPTGDAVIESSFMHFYVCRHSPEVVPALFGNSCAYMMKKQVVANDAKKAT